MMGKTWNQGWHWRALAQSSVKTLGRDIRAIDEHWVARCCFVAGQPSNHGNSDPSLERHVFQCRTLDVYILYPQEAVRLLLSGKSVFPEDHPMSTYHYSGTKLWSARERQQFRRAWRVHRKQFYLLKSAVSGVREGVGACTIMKIPTVN